MTSSFKTQSFTIAHADSGAFKGAGLRLKQRCTDLRAGVLVDLSEAPDQVRGSGGSRRDCFALQRTEAPA